MMDAGQEVTLADVRAALQRQNMREDDIRPGDAVFFNTGWGSLWLKDNDALQQRRAGAGDGGRALAGRSGRSWSPAPTAGRVEAVPNPDPKLVFPVHGELIARNGIHIHENLVFDGLIADRKYQFAYIFCPIPMKGATGSPGGPIAVT